MHQLVINILEKYQSDVNHATGDNSIYPNIITVRSLLNLLSFIYFRQHITHLKKIGCFKWKVPENTKYTPGRKVTRCFCQSFYILLLERLALYMFIIPDNTNHMRMPSSVCSMQRAITPWPFLLQICIMQLTSMGSSLCPLIAGILPSLNTSSWYITLHFVLIPAVIRSKRKTPRS